MTSEICDLLTDLAEGFRTRSQGDTPPSVVAMGEAWIAEYAAQQTHYAWVSELLFEAERIVASSGACLPGPGLPAEPQSPPAGA